MKTTQVAEWDLIVATMHYRGVAPGLLNGTAYAAVAAEGDGYGRMTVAQLKAAELVYDWSHVRDSSPEATARMAAKIRKLVPDAETVVGHMLAIHGGPVVRS